MLDKRGMKAQQVWFVVSDPCEGDDFVAPGVGRRPLGVCMRSIEC